MPPRTPRPDPFFSLEPHAEMGARLPALDGLRAIAVLLVFAHHGEVPFLQGGFVGVDLFFVLSGFLITQLLLKSHAECGRIQFTRFYSHRFIRLFPALALVCLALGLQAAGSHDLPARWPDIWPALTYATDFARNRPGAPDLLGHTWSLAVEEQFYVLWPLALTALLLLGLRARTLAVILAAGMLAVAAWRCALFFDAGAMRAYGSLDTHADGLMAGCLLSLCTRRTLGLIGCLWPLGAMVLALVTAFSEWTDPRLYLGGLTLIALSAASILAALVVQPRWSPAPLLNLAPLRLTGRFSYGAYLWNYPLLQLLAVQLHLGPQAAAALAAPLTLAIAGASFVLVERPLLARRDVMPGWLRVATALAGPACLAIGVALVAIG